MNALVGYLENDSRAGERTETALDYFSDELVTGGGYGTVMVAAPVEIDEGPEEVKALIEDQWDKALGRIPEDMPFQVRMAAERGSRREAEDLMNEFLNYRHPVSEAVGEETEVEYLMSPESYIRAVARQRFGQTIDDPMEKGYGFAPGEGEDPVEHIRESFLDGSMWDTMMGLQEEHPEFLYSLLDNTLANERADEYLREEVGIDSGYMDLPRMGAQFGDLSMIPSVETWNEYREMLAGDLRERIVENADGWMVENDPFTGYVDGWRSRIEGREATGTDVLAFVPLPHILPVEGTLVTEIQESDGTAIPYSLHEMDEISGEQSWS